MALDHPLNVPRTDPDAHLHTYIATAHLPSAIMQSSFYRQAEQEQYIVMLAAGEGL